MTSFERLVSKIREKKVSLKELRELLEKRPEKVGTVLSKSGVVVEKYVTSNIDEWFEEFTEVFNRFERQLKEKLHRLKSLRAGSIYTEEQEQGMMIVLEEILGEANNERME